MKNYQLFIEQEGFPDQLFIQQEGFQWGLCCQRMAGKVSAHWRAGGLIYKKLRQWHIGIGVIKKPFVC